MMDEIEVKHEFPIYEDRCAVCLSVGRKLSFLGQYNGVFKQLTLDLEHHKQMCLEEIQICWECSSFLRKANEFRHHVNKANELFQQGQICSTQSNLTIVILSESHPHTVYITDANTPTDKICDNIDDLSDHDDACDADIGDELLTTEELAKENTEPKKSKTNRWATKRALLNKKPKFKILTASFENSFKIVPIDNEELRTRLKSERDSKYYKSKRFKCDKCVLVFKNEEFLEKHEKKFHSKLRRYTCDICNSRISNKRHLSRHISNHYYKYACILCDFVCCDKSHQQWHHERRHRRVFQCVTCLLKFGCRREFFKHYKEWHEKFVCDYCGISFKMRYCIKDHIRKQHSPFECKPCNKRWARYNGLWLHNKTTHGVSKGAYCVECDRHYRDVYRYRWHLANSTRHRRHTKYRIPCPGCDKVFSKNIYMKDHYNLVHLKFYKYRCEECDKNFIRNADLVKHTRRIHEGILPPKNKICYMCGRGFSTNKILTNHLRTHTGEKPFACTICNARFAQRTALSAHARAIHHTREK